METDEMRCFSSECVPFTNTKTGKNEHQRCSVECRAKGFNTARRSEKNHSFRYLFIQFAMMSTKLDSNGLQLD